MNQKEWRPEFRLFGRVPLRRQSGDELFHFGFLVNFATNGKPLLLRLNSPSRFYPQGEREKRAGI
jgi:hypothetical protein